MELKNDANGFIELGLSKKYAENLAENRIYSPTSIQKNTFKYIIIGKNMIASAKTGSGKTLAFILPLIEKHYKVEIYSNNIGEISSDDKERTTHEDKFISNAFSGWGKKSHKSQNEISKKKYPKSENAKSKKREPKILILAPTRELAAQIDESISLVTKSISSLAAYGGKDINSQINALKRGIDIITATPGRLLDHLNRNSLDLSHIEAIVIDEVDNMLLMGFEKDIESIYKFVPKRQKKNIQWLFFSATVDKKTKKLAYKYADNFLMIEEDREESPKIKERFIKTTDRNKYEDLFKLLKEENPFMAIIFTRTKARADKLEEKMKSEGFNCEKIHSDISQNKRERTLRDFKNLKIQYIIATDIAQRGLDIDGITHIINFDSPERQEDYIHRIGRTARMGKDGESITFLTDKDESIKI